MDIDIKRPGSAEWESLRALGSVKLAEMVGSLVRYPFGGSYLVTRITGLSEPDESGQRYVLSEVYTGE